MIGTRYSCTLNRRTSSETDLSVLTPTASLGTTSTQRLMGLSNSF